MANEDIVITIIGSVATTVISIVILRFLRFFEKKQDKKAEEVKNEAVVAAAKVKANVDDMAKDLAVKLEDRNKTHKEETARIASDLKISTEKMVADLQASVHASNIIMQNKNIEQSHIILDNIKSVDTRLSDMISTLQYKSDLTNGNIKVIREDLLELQEDMDMVFDKVNKNETALNPSQKLVMPSETLRRKAKKRKFRRKTINENAFAQEMHKAV
jgi:hypothetical protein